MEQRFFSKSLSTGIVELRKDALLLDLPWRKTTILDLGTPMTRRPIANLCPESLAILRIADFGNGAP